MRTVRYDFTSPHKPIGALVCLAIALMAAVACAPAHATSVATMSVQTLADHAAQVIIGRVQSADSYWSDEHHQIETTVELIDVQYLKGRITGGAESDSTGETFRLIIPGGTVGTKHMTVCCAPAPRVGQRWMFFLLESYRTFPVVGVYQGAFRIHTDAAGVERVYREAHGQLRGVAGISDDGFLRVEQPPTADPHDKLVGANRMRITANNAAKSSAPAMRLADFTAMLEPVLADSRKYELTQSAGRYVMPVRTATTLRAANASSSGVGQKNSPGTTGAVRKANVTTAGVADRTPARDVQP